ncbi:hypothetical protein [Mesorhizobium sp. B1-1-8]|uniref:hypothetical protein n=1 Tax=Mesorhizobium sp. B1-1-8 TaxID=2589976 RepID=UPI00112D6194|nr:hypothetical protein [Mesorhizobium sp. B1-1-8]UCI08679.1 hypothetical protein FJ974_06310 [Mesorhizobium sp. B1-1-8]
MGQTLTNPAIMIPLVVCIAWVLWVLAPGWFMRRELARYARMDGRREYERAKLADALTPLAGKAGADEVEAAIERHLDGR